MNSARFSLNFLCVGGAKCATTTLHHWLSANPALCLPLDKEAPIFHRVKSDETVSLELGRAFAHMKAGQIAGKITPHYLVSPGSAPRIAHRFPNVSIIVLVREPVARAYSHYRMRVRRGEEFRGFEQAVMDELRRGPGVLEHSYLAGGAWKDLLEPFEEQFSKTLVLATSAFSASPIDTLNRVSKFIDVDVAYPDQLERSYNVNRGQADPFEKILRRAVYSPAVRPWARRLSPVLRQRFAFWLETRGSSSQLQASEPAPLENPAVRDAVSEYFSPHIEYVFTRYGIDLGKRED